MDETGEVLLFVLLVVVNGAELSSTEKEGGVEASPCPHMGHRLRYGTDTPVFYEAPYIDYT